VVDSDQRDLAGHHCQWLQQPPHPTAGRLCSGSSTLRGKQIAMIDTRKVSGAGMNVVRALMSSGCSRTFAERALIVTVRQGVLR
jgi:hypothetical protein